MKEANRMDSAIPLLEGREALPFWIFDFLRFWVRSSSPCFLLDLLLQFSRRPVM